MTFTVNNQIWHLEFVKPNSIELMRSDGSITIGMTDNNTKTVYINNRLNDYMTDKCIAHELCHVFCFSHNIYMSLQEEEYLADWVSRYGRDLIRILDDIMFIISKNRVA